RPARGDGLHRLQDDRGAAHQGALHQDLVGRPARVARARRHHHQGSAELSAGARMTDPAAAITQRPTYTVDDDARAEAREVAERARAWRRGRGVDTTGLARLHAWMSYAVVYHSNALEGGGLTETETKAVLVDGFTVGGKPLRDHLWAVNLSVASE